MSTCANCRFWHDGQTLGMCRRRAPYQTVAPQWPITERDDWCGEHEPASNGVTTNPDGTYTSTITFGPLIDEDDLLPRQYGPAPDLMQPPGGPL